MFLILLLTLPICGGAPLLTIIASSGLFLLGLGYYFIDKKPIKFLIGLSAELSSENDTDLLNLRDEMLAEVNKLAYLLTLE